MELLVVIATIGLLAAVLLPSLSGARDQARSAVCGSNLRQIVLAGEMYAADNRGHYFPGARDILQNLHRWHGTRDQVGAPFDPRRGPLTGYLGEDGRIQDCPSFDVDLPEDDPRRFERGCGGYGYNNAFIGRQLRDVGFGFRVVEDDDTGVRTERVRSPATTVLLADTGFVNGLVIEYSFVEPRFMPETGTRPDPSIHFRHRGLANVAWCDGHVDSRRRTWTWSSGLYAGDPGRLGTGWFGQRDDNYVFDLR
ncbi:MAG: hypothetical protein GY778_10340 [bacterium]|nr:hypothetical protein [bacterium]